MQFFSSDLQSLAVKAASAYLHEPLNDVALAAPTGEALEKLQQVKQLGVKISARGDEPPVLTGEELTATLQEVASQLVAAFQEVQVQVSEVAALQTATSPRAKFEFEMLQHHPDLEVLVLTSTNTGDDFVLFALPLLGEKPEWDPKELLETENPELSFIPDGFHAPNFSVSADVLTIFVGYPMADEEVKFDGAWPLFVEWPARMLLSSQVTQIPPSSKAQSSIELIASCKKVLFANFSDF
ncbi:unnamed protein product [Phytophthora fragariaefolia]|uniref:Unnamed protein product n=1 Tax=Phytophthora fragariaefolia TaxID=1490495 RepID=A0A9W6XQ51_9STRA|nr:unnamed protein product [Phytophthora fragariaefolia]